MIRSIALASLLALAAGGSWVRAERSDDPRPNMIYIMVDDLGYGDLGCYGQTRFGTPNIDRLASEGVRFTDHYAGHTVCRPSRLVLWLGKHCGTTGLIGNRARSLTGKEQTVAKLLQEGGYATGGVGKWALGNVDSPRDINNAGHPNNNGFDYWCGYLNQSNAHNFYPTFLWENKKQIELPGNVIGDDPRGRGRVAVKRVTYSHDVMAESALKFIKANHQQPFLLHVHWTIPHANNEGGRVTGDGMEVPSHGEFAAKDWPSPEKGFAAMIQHMDKDVGRIQRLLMDLEIDEQTLLIFTSDNGPHSEGGHKHEFFDSNGPLKGYKRSMHDGGIRVPFIARWPGRIKAGTTSAHPSAFYDFLPTACELAGVAPPADCDGISYAPTLLGKAKEQKRHEYLYWASQEGATSVGVRYGKWKLVRYRQKQNKRKASQTKPDWRLYDLTTDLGEENNVAAEHPQVVAKILGLLERDNLLKRDTPR